MGCGLTPYLTNHPWGQPHSTTLSPPLQVVEGGLRPALKKGWPPLLCALLEECWHVQPVRRPGMREVCGRLRELLSVK